MDKLAFGEGSASHTEPHVCPEDSVHTFSRTQEFQEDFFIVYSYFSENFKRGKKKVPAAIRPKLLLSTDNLQWKVS